MGGESAILTVNNVANCLWYESLYAARPFGGKRKENIQIQRVHWKDALSCVRTFDLNGRTGTNNVFCERFFLFLSYPKKKKNEKK